MEKPDVSLRILNRDARHVIQDLDFPARMLKEEKEARVTRSPARKDEGRRPAASALFFSRAKRPGATDGFCNVLSTARPGANPLRPCRVLFEDAHHILISVVSGGSIQIIAR